jgi:hypothetical protein
MVRHPVTGKYRRTRLFIFTLGYSRKSVRLLTFASSTRCWCELHEESLRRLGGTVQVIVLDKPPLGTGGSVVPPFPNGLALRREPATRDPWAPARPDVRTLPYWQYQSTVCRGGWTLGRH